VLSATGKVFCSEGTLNVMKRDTTLVVLVAGLLACSTATARAEAWPWQEKLGRHHASPVLVGGLVFLVNDNGEVNVIKPGAEFKHVAKYELGESCYASPAISDGQVFLRGFKHLFCFGKKAN
jgi:hypothetical protein